MQRILASVIFKNHPADVRIFRHFERRFILCVLCGSRGPGLQDHEDNFSKTVARRNVQDGVFIRISGIHIGLLIQKKESHFFLIVLNCRVKGSNSVIGSAIDWQPKRQESKGNFNIAIACSETKPAFSSSITTKWRRDFVCKKGHNLQVPMLGSE